MNEMIRDYTVIDLEMTGLDIKRDKIIEIGAVKVRDGIVVDTYATFVKVNRMIPEKITELTGITKEMTEAGKEEDVAMEELLAFMGEDVLLGQNFGFDYSFLQQWAANHKSRLTNRYLDTLKIARAILPAEQKKSLDALCAYFDIKREQEHRAYYDAIETHEVYEKLIAIVTEKDRPELAKWFEPREFTYRVKKISPMTNAQRQQIQKYREVHGVTEPIEWEALTRSEASRLMERYYQTYGR